MARRLWSILLIFFLVIALTSSFVVIPQGKVGLLLTMAQVQKGKDQKTLVLQPGLHFKWPLVSQVQQLDTRVQLLSIDVPFQRSTLDGVAEYVAYWQIVDPNKFYQATDGRPLQANQLIEQQLKSGLQTETVSMNTGALTEQSEKLRQSLGVKLLNLDYKGVRLSQNALNNIYQSMRDKQDNIAKSVHLDAKLAAEKIANDAQASATISEAKARAKASAIRASGDQSASQIYVNAYQKDPDFYDFLIHLDAYQKIFAHTNDKLLLTPNMQFFRYFNYEQQQSEKDNS